MAQKIYIVEGRQFRTESDYGCAKRDKIIIDKLRQETNFNDRTELETLQKELKAGKYKFMTLLGQDFKDEVDDRLKKMPVQVGKSRNGKGNKGKKGQNIQPAKTTGHKSGATSSGARGGSTTDRHLRRVENTASKRTEAKGNAQPSQKRTTSGEPADEVVQAELRKMERSRKIILSVCGVLAACCLGYFGIYSYENYRTQKYYQQLNQMKEAASAISTPRPEAAATPAPTGPLYTLDEEPEEKEVLEEYKNLLLKNQKLIGWVKIDGTNIDFPVMQTDDNEYYLTHNMNQENDRNGTIFMDKDCDVLKPSTNFILYGHHMRSGNMFGKLDYYQNKSYYEEHPYINFDTIYEKGVYQIMYVFRSRVYSETEIVFKYYQFIDANGEQEFDSYMQEMADLSLYDTGVTAEYGDQLLTLSTCDYQETNGRFVVVAKRISDDE